MRVFSPEKIRERRLHLELSQEDLATAAGLTREHLVEIEKGRSIPRATTIARLAKALKVKESYFFVDAKQNQNQT